MLGLFFVAPACLCLCLCLWSFLGFVFAFAFAFAFGFCFCLCLCLCSVCGSCGILCRVFQRCCCGRRVLCLSLAMVMLVAFVLSSCLCLCLCLCLWVASVTTKKAQNPHPRSHVNSNYLLFGHFFCGVGLVWGCMGFARKRPNTHARYSMPCMMPPTSDPNFSGSGVKQIPS